MLSLLTDSQVINNGEQNDGVSSAFFAVRSKTVGLEVEFKITLRKVLGVWGRYEGCLEGSTVCLQF